MGKGWCCKTKDEETDFLKKKEKTIQTLDAFFHSEVALLIYFYFAINIFLCVISKPQSSAEHGMAEAAQTPQRLGGIFTPCKVQR